MADWHEADHPRDSEGQFTESWANQVAAALPGSIFDSFTDPAFSEPSDYQHEQARNWAHTKLEYIDRSTGYRSRVFDIEHGGDGFTVSGSFEDGSTTIGHWQVGVLKDEDGARVGVVEGIELDADRRGEGLAKRWARRLEDVLRAEGVVRISMWDMSGGFWEHLGYARDRRGTGVKQL